MTVLATQSCKNYLIGSNRYCLVKLLYQVLTQNFHKLDKQQKGIELWECQKTFFSKNRFGGSDK